MSGLEAISAAAAIIQFVDFGSKLLVTGYDIYKSQAGAAPGAIHVQTVCDELEAISSHLSQPSTTNVPLTGREQALWDLAYRAHNLAWHLGLLLGDLKLKKTSFGSWGALRQSWRVLRRNDKIEEMKAQLADIKGLLDTNLLILLRNDSSLLIKLVNDQTHQSRHLHDDNINTVQILKREILVTMRTHRDDILRSDGVLLRTIGDQLAELASRSTTLQKSERILESLYCEEVHKRELAVSDAESRTFSWAFDSWCTGHRLTCGCSCSPSNYGTSDTKCWKHRMIPDPPCSGQDSCQAHFVNWLECNNTREPFMITGKPGSGKSTFMKFIASHEATRRALDTWSSGRELVIASFFFWSSGTPLQRSQDGLLRCLLYKILSQAPDMISVAVPRRWQTSGQMRSAEPWSRSEIWNAFANVVSANLLSTNFCFFIDGLDEYGGSDLGSSESDLDLVLQLKTLSSSPHVKLCLSSRPRNVFKGHFPDAGPHHIALHDHTTKDIERLVESRIGRVHSLISIEAADLEELKRLIVEKSSGVFLWVVLALRELLDGLEPPFSMPELQKRLLLLPETLDGYFQRILDKVHQQYRRFNARLLLMSAYCTPLELCYIYSLWLMEQGHVGSGSYDASDTGRHNLHSDPRIWLIDTRARIAKVCGDFLTVRDYPGSSTSPFIEHNHLSVVDFLRLPAVGRQLFALAEWHDESDIRLTFCKTFLSCCEEGITNLERDKSPFHFFALHARLYEYHSGISCADLIFRLDGMMCSSSVPPSRNGIQHWTGRLVNVCHPEWIGSEAQELILFMALHGLQLSVEYAIRTLSEEAQTSVFTDILATFLLGCYHRPTFNGSTFNLLMVEFLCSKGANVNSVARKTTTSVAGGNGDIKADQCQIARCTKRQSESGLDTGNSCNGSTDCTIWELYLQERDFKRWHAFNKLGISNLVVKLIEAGANLECRLPAGCENVQQAIFERLKAEKRGKPLSDSELEPVRAALSRRGFAFENVYR